MDTVTPQSSMSPEQRMALADAMRGDWDAANAMELAHLNASKEIKVRILELLGKEADVSPDQLRAIELEHARGQASVTAVVWTLAESCEDCGGDGTLTALGVFTRTVDCPSCWGTGFDEDEDIERVRTDIDGNLLEDAQEAMTEGLFGGSSNE